MKNNIAIAMAIKFVFGWTIICAVILNAFLSTTAFALVEGPYYGQVMDRETKEPIAGASVLIHWTMYYFTPFGGHSADFKANLVYTDRRGNFKIGRTLAVTGPLSSIDEITFMVYQPGYHVFISKDSMWEKHSDELFRKEISDVELKRIPPNFDYQRHYERITHALGGMGRMGGAIIPPTTSSPSGDIRMRWDEFIGESLLNAPKKEFLRRVEWENRRR